MTAPETPQAPAVLFHVPPEDRQPSIGRVRERLGRILEVRDRIAARIAAHPDDPAVAGMKVRLAEFDAEEAYFETLLGPDVLASFRTSARAAIDARLKAEAEANAAEAPAAPAEPAKEG